jgi:hypothetical protein
MPAKTPESFKPVSITPIAPSPILKKLPIGYEVKPLPSGMSYQYSYYDPYGKSITEEQYYEAKKREREEREREEREKTIEDRIAEDAQIYFKDRTPTEREYKEYYLGRLLWYYNKYGYIPSSYLEEFKSRRPPSRLVDVVGKLPVSEKMKENILGKISYSKVPWQFETLGREARSKYIQESYETAIGKQDIAKMEKDLNRYFQRFVTVAWAKRHSEKFGAVFGERGDLTWEEYKRREPAAYFAKGQYGGITVEVDPRRWQREQDIAWAERQRGKPFWEWDLGYPAKRFLSEVFSPERFETALKDVLYGAPGIYKDVVVTPARPEVIGTPVGWKPTIVESRREFEYGREKIFAGSQYEYTKAWEQKDWGKIALRAIGSPAGSILLFTGVGTLAKYGARAIVSPVKYVVRKTPDVYGRYTQVFPRGSGLRTEYGKIIGRTYARQLVSDIGQTQWWRNIYGWSTDSLVRVRYLPLYKTVRTDLGEGFKGKIDIYRGWGRTEWVTPKEAYQTGIGKTGYASLYEFQTGEWHGIQSKAMVQQILKPKGHLWWKTIRVSSVGYSEFEPFVFESGKAIGGRGITDIWGGYIKPQTPVFIGVKDKIIKPSMADIWKDETAFQTLAHPIRARPMISHGLKHIGYLAGRTIVIPKTVSIPTISIKPFMAAGVVSSSLAFGILAREKVKPDFKIDFDIKKMYDVSLESAIRQRIDVEEAMKIDESYLQVQLVGYSQKQAVLQQQLLYSSLSTRQKAIPVSMTPFPYFKTKVSAPKTFKLFKPDIVDSLKPAPGQGFDVLVKDRVYVKGKRKYDERFVKVNRVPLGRLDALSLGGSAVDNSAAATFKIRRASGKKAKPLKLRTVPWGFISHKFDVRPGDVFVEPSLYRIDTSGEVRGISAL